MTCPTVRLLPWKFFSSLSVHELARVACSLGPKPGSGEPKNYDAGDRTDSTRPYDMYNSTSPHPISAKCNSPNIHINLQGKTALDLINNLGIYQVSKALESSYCPFNDRKKDSNLDHPILID